MEYNYLSKNALKCRYVKATITAIIELIILAVVICFAKDIENMWVYVGFIVIGVGIVAYGAIKPYIYHINYKYYINDEFIEVEQGKLFKERIIVPIERLHKIEVSQGPIAKVFGIADIKVVSGGGEVNLEYIDAEYANDVAIVLGKRINEVTIKQREDK